MKKQTSVEWLEKQINNGLSDKGLQSAIKQAKAMEKEQIIQACYDGNKKRIKNKYSININDKNFDSLNLEIQDFNIKIK